MAPDDEESQTSPALGGSDVATASAAPTASDTHANGYDRLAAFMGEFPEYAIYRRFGTLNSLNLLYLQAELVMLESELKQYAAEDANSAEGYRSLYARNWHLMSNQTGGQPRQYTKQWKTALRIRKVLRQYTDQEILAQNQIAQLAKPGGMEVNFLCDWMKESDKGFVYLSGDDADLWKRHITPMRDFIAIGANSYDDAISSWLTRHAIRHYHKYIGRHYKKQNPDSNAMAPAYSHKYVIRFVSALTIMLSSLFPIASICLLNRVHTTSAKIYIVCGFTLVFAACVGAFNPAKRVETFAATMAFAAVQVVFITGDRDAHRAQS